MREARGASTPPRAWPSDPLCPCSAQPLDVCRWISTRHPTTHLACCEGRDLLAAADGSFTVTLYAYMPQLTRAGREEEGRLQPFQVTLEEQGRLCLV